jgi:hypothetical protein
MTAKAMARPRWSVVYKAATAEPKTITCLRVNRSRGLRNRNAWPLLVRAGSCLRAAVGAA